MFISELFPNDLEEAKKPSKKEEPVKWIPVDTVEHPLGSPYSPKNKYIGSPKYNSRIDTKTDEGTVSELPTSWDKDNKSQGKRVRMSHREAHKIMTPEEYQEIRHKLGPHEFDPNIGGEQGIVGIRYTGQNKVTELTQGYPD